MVAPAIRFSVEGDGVVIKDLERLNSKSKNMAPAFRQIADDMLRSHEANFKTQGAKFGSRWAPRRYSYGWPILKKTGALSRGFRGSSNNNYAEVTNTVSYAKYHQLGTRKLPVRNLIGIDDPKDINSAINRIRHHLELERM